MPVSAALEHALPGLCEAAAINKFNSITHQWLGHIIDIEVQSIEEMDKARVHIHALECALNQIDPFQAEVSATELQGLEVSKALKNIVDIKSESGEWYTITIPKNKKALDKDPNAAQWHLSHQAAHESVLSNPLNSLVKRKNAKALGAIISPVVMQDSIKKDADGKLLKFKSRLCSAGDQVKRIQEARGITDFAPAHATISDNLQFKLMFSTATLGDVQDEYRRRVLPWRYGQDEHVQAASLRELMAANPALRRVPNDVTSTDFKNAYPKAQRLRAIGFMETYEPMFDDEGDELCYRLGAPIWGEAAAGNEWEQDRNKRLIEAGMTESLTVPGAWSMEDENVDSYLVIITNVDDILYKETGGRNRILTERLIAHFKKCYGADDVTVKYKPLSWNGYALAWAADGSVDTLTMEQHIVQLARDYVPELLDIDAPLPSDLLSGIKLQAAADALCKPEIVPKKMCAAGKETQQIVGATSYITAGVHVRFSLLQHRLACVASMAKQPEALTVARSFIAALYARRKEGITYGGQLAERVMLQGGLYANVDLETTAPEGPEVHADANVDGRSVYALVLTHNGGTVAHAVKKISTVVEIVDELGSVGNESVATERASQVAVYASEILRTLGHPPTSPIMIGTDNSANLTLGLGTATPGKAKHAMRRWAHIRAQVRLGTITLAKVDTVSMPVDFMTKWKGKKQTDTAVNYLTNAKNQIVSDAVVNALEVSMLDQKTLRLRGGTFFGLSDDDTAIGHKPLGLYAGVERLPPAHTDRLNPLYQVYAANLPAPDELQFDYVAFRTHNAELAQRAADRGDPFTFGCIANGAVNLYLGTGTTLFLVKQAIASIELKECRRIAGPAAPGADAKDTDAPGWGRHEEMNDKDYDDVRDAWMSYSTTIDERKRRAEQHLNTARADDDDDGDPYGDKSSKYAKPETFSIEVSMLEADAPFMMMRSGTRKYQTPPPPVGAPQPLPADDDAPPPAPAAPDPPPDTTHADPKYFANRLFADFAGPSASRGVSYQTNREGLLPSDEDYDPELDAEFYGRDSDEPYEDQ